MRPSRTYQWYGGDAVFRFGHGLHYTNFSVGFNRAELTSKPSKYATAELVNQKPNPPAPHKDLLPFTSVPVTVANKGSVTSDFVVLAFLKGEYGPKPLPIKRLVGFSRVHDVEPGETANTTISIDIGTIARGDEKGDLVLFPGQYKLVLDIDDVDTWEFAIEGDKVVLDSWPQR
jgi:xylan 1,4-beta-xylosidase